MSNSAHPTQFQEFEDYEASSVEHAMNSGPRSSGRSNRVRCSIRQLGSCGERLPSFERFHRRITKLIDAHEKAEWRDLRANTNREWDRCSSVFPLHRQLWSSSVNESEFGIGCRMQQAADSFLREIRGSSENIAT